ncbi:diguanylate cyclase (GGDEF) domain-containing protein [Cryobacterium flavum]|uniref:Diguanylate cyclase (GGDEF) domain-containing protein n=1 Tax=Cryobacterium flavum TaxID=1424659 RepID=A0A4R8V3B8_9MICO|nr:EAL domain-containing protein [Cryobacterium flavum]TFB77130.1 EAL domain-containing protein [Cryobacterium flavum]SDN38657.1 diguanylate cyclase (GGDEF) domain-containing protein [Cryobacterium flavum]
MSRSGVWGVLQRISFGVFTAVGLVFIPGAIAIVLEDPGARIAVALIGVVCVGALEIAWIRVGSVPHRTPAISVPVLAVPALVPVLPNQAIIGVVMLGILLALIIESRRIGVAVYSAGLAGVGCMVYFFIDWVLATSTVAALPAVAAASVGYVLFVLAIELIRIRLIGAPADRGGRPLVSPLRVGALLLVVAALTAFSASWAENGLPTPGQGRTSLETAVGTLLGSFVVALIAIVVRILSDMRRRLNGIVVGSSLLTTTRRADNVADMLCDAAANAIGVQSITVEVGPAEGAAIGAPFMFTPGEPRFLVARRDPMDGSFSGVDRRALQALAATAELSVQARQNVAGLTIKANTDPLTGLPNYGAFQEALDTINSTRSDAEAIAVLFMDLDGFKRLNDTYGHQTGDEVLRVLGQRLRQSVRPHDVVARVGGDEFVIILTRLATLDEAKAIAETVLTASALPLAVGADTLNPSLSIGLAYSVSVETDVASLVHDADHSMLMVKKSRRRGSIGGESSINVSGHRSSQFNDTVARAIDDNQLPLAYQPIVSLITGSIWAFEALLRYTDPVLGAISPPSIIEKAKSLGRFDKLTRQIAETAMAAAAEFRLVEPGIVCMTINVEAGQLAPERLGQFVEQLNDRYPAISLCLELNERSAVRVTAEIREQANRLRDLGILIALDDYGSEDSSVDSLVRVPMDILKIDRSLVDDLADVRQREVLTALQSFGDKLEYSMIVEGVENEHMAQQLARLGIRSAQGFHFGVPQGFAETVARLDEFGAKAVLTTQTAHATVTPS